MFGYDDVAGPKTKKIIIKQKVLNLLISCNLFVLNDPAFRSVKKIFLILGQDVFGHGGPETTREDFFSEKKNLF